METRLASNSRDISLPLLLSVGWGLKVCTFMRSSVLLTRGRAVSEPSLTLVRNQLFEWPTEQTDKAQQTKHRLLSSRRMFCCSTSCRLTQPRKQQELACDNMVLFTLWSCKVYLLW